MAAADGPQPVAHRLDLGRPGTSADEGGGRNSVFAKAFIAALQTNHDILQGYSLYQSVTDKVRSRAARLGVTQIPEYAPIRRAGHENRSVSFHGRELKRVQ